MRRKFPGKKPDPNVPPVPGSGASVPARPSELKQAAGELQESLLGREAHVATGYGFGDDPRDRTPAWRLYVFTDEPRESLPLPAEVMGFPVSRRSVPVARPATSGRKW
jgi:hypothetical protein